MGNDCFENVSSAEKEIEESIRLTIEKLENQKESVEKLVQELLLARKESKEVILLGVGRSGDVLSFFATRLVQPIEFGGHQERMFEKGQVKIVSERSFEPVIMPGTLVICLTGTGKTHQTIIYAENYLAMNSKLVMITSNQASKLWDRAAIKLFIPGLTAKDFAKSEYAFGQDQPLSFTGTHPGPTFFELNALILLESIFATMKKQIELDKTTQT